MSLSSAVVANLDAPFPGLRPFAVEEALLFCGREQHVAELLARLDDHRLVAVTGTSGSGKSSLVHAGLLPALHRGYLVGSTTKWRFATMRPGNRPLDALAESLAAVLPGQPVTTIRDSLHATSAGLTSIVARAALAAGESLLVIADQFEELFRFDVTRDQQANSALFVSLLLQAAEQRETPIYVVVTMRSEFLGRCAEFAGLAEAFNRSQYLVPRLTRDERREAIERPLRLVGATPSPALVQQVLNDAGEDPDQLPVLQHALLRTFRHWQRSGRAEKVEREHYDVVGGIQRALDLHGEEILSRLSGDAQRTAERLFRSLTVTQAGVALRRPHQLRDLYSIVGSTDADGRREVDEIISMFAHRDHVFLTLSSPTLSPDTIVDITHESLIRKWSRLQSWVRNEARSAEWYGDLARDVRRHQKQEGGYWQDPELAEVQRRWRDDTWTEAWANQYCGPDDPTFADVRRFVEESAHHQAERQRHADEQRDRELRQAMAIAAARRRISISLAVMLVAAASAAFMMYRLAIAQGQIAAISRDNEATAESLQIATQQYAGDLARLTALLDERSKLVGSSSSVSERARSDELTREIEAVRALAKGSQDELAKIKKDQAAGASDRNALLTELGTLRRQLGEVTAERDKQLAPLSVMVRNAYLSGVRLYQARDWQGAVQKLYAAIEMQSALRPLPKEVQDGARAVPYVPAHYLVGALVELKADCQLVVQALLLGFTEPAPPPELKKQFMEGDSRCGT